MRKQKISRFWKIYLTTTAVFLLFIAAGLGVFYDFIRAYEKAQPEHTAETYTASLSEEIFDEWIDHAAKKLSLVYDTPQSAASACRDALSKLSGEFICQREYASSAETPVYIITRDDVPVGKFTMRETGDGKYGFSAWEVVSGEAILDYLQADNISLSVCIPAYSVLSVNGVSVSDVEKNPENVLYSFASPFEKNTKISSQLYQIDGLYSTPALKCTLNGTECVMKVENGVHWFLYPDSVSDTYTISAPADAAVTVNGVSVGKEYIKETGIRYEYAFVESSESNLPFEVKYEIPGLLSVPQVQVTLRGEKLSLAADGSHFQADYPQSQMYAYTLKVPQGSTVTMRGVSCAPYKSAEQEDAYPGLYSDTARAPKYDIYQLNGLFLPAERINILYNGGEYSANTTQGENIIVQYPQTENQEAADSALQFARDYFTYISGGYNNTQDNLARALTHVKQGSALYGSIQRSLIGIQFVTPVSSQSYNTLEITDIRLMPAGEIYCKVVFDIDQKIYHVSRSYSGSLSLVTEKIGNTWKITEMLTDSHN